MNRRELLKMAATAVTVIPAAGSRLAAAEPITPATSRTPALAKYEQLRFGVSYHFSMNTFTGDDYETGAVPASRYNPTRLDVRQWIRVARGLGARYAVLTAKHMSGFCLWDSKDYDYDVAASGNKTDVVAAFVAACQEYGLMPGFYYCILDPHNEGKFDWNASVKDDYYALMRHHLTELHTRYPNTFYQLLDITWKVSQEQRWDLYRLIKQHSPNCMVIMNQGFDQSRRNRGRICETPSWPSDVINAEDTLPPPEGHDPHVTVDGKKYYMPMETWLPTGPIYAPMPRMHSWFWRQEYKTQGADVIAQAYRDCMKHGANLLLNLAPDKTGQIPGEAVATMRDVANKIKIA
jgi:alpha-L-fucosidase